MRSLRSTLIAWLVPPLLIVGAVAASGAYVFMERRLTSAYDLDLGDIARAMLPYLHARDGRVTLELSELAVAVLKSDSNDHIYYAVFDEAGNTVVGDRALHPPPLRPGHSPMFWNGTRLGAPIRAVTLEAAVGGMPVTVVAAETTQKRERAYRDALFSAIAPVVLLSLAAVLAIAFGVRRGLDPLGTLQEELQSRSHRHLQPVDLEPVARELKPLVRELNGMLARLEQAQHTQARFIANAAHQLRTPVAGLVTQLDLARRDDADRDLHLAHAREGAARLARLTRQILSLAVADPISNPEANEESFDLAAVVKDRADSWVRAATARGAEIEFELQPAPMHGVRLLAGELAENLVDNATRYGAKTVRIATRAEDGAVLEVSDDGPGIPASERQRMFERFQRLDNQATEGSGLGLAIVREIAQRHGATVELTEASGPSGTRVVVHFPPRPAAAASPPDGARDERFVAAAVTGRADDRRPGH
jgi:two-component system sensor histidine kinase TctE